MLAEWITEGAANSKNSRAKCNNLGDCELEPSLDRVELPTPIPTYAIMKAACTRLHRPQKRKVKFRPRNIAIALSRIHLKVP